MPQTEDYTTQLQGLCLSLNLLFGEDHEEGN